jgi:hypothetical protein
MKLNRGWFLLLAGALLLSALPAAAQMEKGLVEISPMIGYQWQTGGIPMKDGYQTALTVGYCFTNHWEGEFELTYGQARLYGGGFLGPEEINGNSYVFTENSHVTTFRANLLYNWNLNKWSPFIKFGLGKLQISPLDTTDVKSWHADTTAQFGGGFRYFFNKNIALRGEANIIWYLTSNYFGGNYWPSGNPYPYQYQYVNESSPYYWEALIGVSFFMHRPAPPPPPPTK